MEEILGIIVKRESSITLLLIIESATYRNTFFIKLCLSCIGWNDYYSNNFRHELARVITEFT